jgi:CRISPR-associated protein Csb1
MTIGLDRLRNAVAKDAAIRRVQRLQPTGGPGDKIFPPTYPPADEEKRANRNAPPRHVFETRRIGGQNVLCVLIDSVQSQANRLEEALKAAREGNALTFPVIAVEFAGTEVDDIGRITTLDAPHRVFDAIVRDSELNGIRFKETAAGKRLVSANAQNARAVYELSPAALIFGAWNSTGEGGGLGAKFPRCVVSEVIGVGVATESRVDARTGQVLERPSGQRTGSRIDPLGIRSGVSVYKLPNGNWSLDPPADGKAKNAY